MAEYLTRLHIWAYALGGVLVVAGVVWWSPLLVCGIACAGLGVLSLVVDALRDPPERDGNDTSGWGGHH